jgi:O-antigen ligase
LRRLRREAHGSTGSGRSAPRLDRTGKRAKERVVTEKPQATRIRYGVFEYGFWAFVLVAVGRVNQMVPGVRSLPVAKVIMLFTVIAWMANRKQLQPLPLPVRNLTRTAILLGGIAVVLTPLSVWKGSSFGFVTTQLPVSLTIVVFACAMRSSWTSIRGTLLALVLSGLVLAAMALLGYSGGRAADAGTMYDTNDLAYVLVTILPIALAFVVNAQSKRDRLIHAATVGILSLALLLTGSRGGLLGFLTVVLLVTFFPLSVPERLRRSALKTLSAKLGALIVVGCLGVMVATHLPEAAQERFSTLLHLNNDYNLNPNDKGGRGDIWRRGLKAAEARPIGYGPDTYEIVDADFGGLYKAPHNSLLQALVELGVLGLVLFLRMYFLALRSLARLRHTLTLSNRSNVAERERAIIARALQFSLLANFVAGFFLSDAYSEVLWLTFGLCIAVLASQPSDAGVSTGSTPSGGRALPKPTERGSPRRNSPALLPSARSHK